MDVQAQKDEEIDTMLFDELKRTKLSFLLDDTYVIAGFSYSGVFYSYQHRNLSYAPGFSFGFEQYHPLGGQAILAVGLNYSQKNFFYRPEQEALRFRNHYLDIPAVASMELPIFRELDFRLMLGANIAFRLASQQVGDYSEAYAQQEGSFMYKPGSFTWFDMGYIFGLSMEYREFLFRLRTVSGLARLDRQDQGMMNSVQLEIGYFLFRKTGRKPRQEEKPNLPDFD